MNGGALTSAAVFSTTLALLTCALSLQARPEYDSKIIQVTGNYGDDQLLGTAAELRFKSFIEDYGKEYATREDYLHRLGIFARNLIRAAEHQAMDPTAAHGVTPFSDLSEEEFEGMYMGVKGGSDSWKLESRAAAAVEVEVGDLPESFDWREKGAVTDVKMQGTCGSCWAFSTTGVIEGSNFIATGKLLNLSQQQLVDCDHACDVKETEACDDGCFGGLMTNAYKYLMEAGGIEAEASYPYTGMKGECKFKPERVAVRVANFTNIPIDEDQIAAYLVRHGPLAVGLNAVFMQTYMGGVSCPLVCSKKGVNHGVVLVGYGSRGFSILRLGNEPYWTIKNSWGPRWGERGYYRLCRGRGMCGMNTMVSACAVVTMAQPH